MAEQKSRKSRKKILVADISHTIRRFMTEYLKDEYEVLEAGSGKEALEIVMGAHRCDSGCLKKSGASSPPAGEERIAAVLLGLEMEDYDALEITRRLRKKHGKHCLPIIISTSNNDRDTVLHAIENGANDLIVKPFPREHLLAKIHKLEHEVAPEDIRNSELVAKIPFFEGVPALQVAYLLNTCSETVLRENGDVVCNQDDDNYDLFILLEGKCEVVFNGRKVGDIEPIDTIGEMGFVAKAKRSATVRAAAPSKIIVLNKQKFDAYLNEERAVHETILKNIILSLNERIKKSNALINKLKVVAQEYLSG